MNRLEVDRVSRHFGSRRVLQEVSFTLAAGESLAVVGRNGSGKTTLLRLIAGLIRPSRGKILYQHEGRRLDRGQIRRNLSYVGPELALYDRLTGAENIHFFSIMRGVRQDRERIESLLESVQLGGRGNDFYGTYSSGMKLRLKYAVALLGEPPLLLLDEPTANLDDEGKEVVAGIMKRQKSKGILIIATNEKEEYGLADRLCRVGS